METYLLQQNIFQHLSTTTFEALSLTCKALYHASFEYAQIISNNCASYMYPDVVEAKKSYSSKYMSFIQIYDC